MLDPPHQAHDADLMVAVSLDAGPMGLRVRLAAALDPANLPQHRVQRLDWEADREAVVIRHQRIFGALVLEERVEAALPSDAASELLRQAALSQADRLLAGDEGVAQLRARVDFLRLHQPDLDLPALDPVALLPAL